MNLKSDLNYINAAQKEILTLKHAQSLLLWDSETYMPSKGLEYRSEQIALLEKIIHERLIDEKLWAALCRLSSPETLKKLSDLNKIIVQRCFKDIQKERKIPSELSEEIARLMVLATEKWRVAKKTNNFKLFSPYLEKQIELYTRKAKCIGLPGHIYNSLLDDYEEGMTVDILRGVFSNLKKEIVSLLKEIKQTKKFKMQKEIFCGEKYDIEHQKELCSWVFSKIIQDADRSRIDVSAHPFTIGIDPDDVRITTRYSETNPISAIFSTIHESGHALYDLDYNKDLEMTFAGEYASYGLHESQSRLWENVIGRSKPFAKALFSQFKKEFPKHLMSFDEFYSSLNHVAASLIRTESDEVTYCLHIILRFELELDMFEGKVKVKDLPRIWKARMKEMFGITPKTDTEGVLQDVHWSQGNFGYFPSYAIGNIYAAQLFAQMKRDVPSIEKWIGKLEFKPLVDWLQKNVHRYRRTLTADEIVRKACGRGLDVGAYVSYLRAKYSEIYGLE